MSSHLPAEGLDAGGRGPVRSEPLVDRLGPYRLVHQVGEGGMGQVYLALDPTGRAVAVKVLRAHVAYDSQARARLARELDTLSRVRHSRVAAVIDADIHGERPYLVTRYVAGPSLNRVVKTRGPLRGHDLVRLARGLVSAVEAIHAVGVVHRDIKPANVLLEDDGDPVLVDFGIAHVADDIRLTSSGLVMGTPGYLSPELIDGATVTEATDWWGWAATVAFAASGREPFGSGPLDVVLSRVRRGEFDLDGVDPRLQPLLAAALSPRPENRPPARVLVTALERYAVSPPATTVLRVVPHPEEQAPPTELLSAPHTEVVRDGAEVTTAFPSAEAATGDRQRGGHLGAVPPGDGPAVPGSARPPSGAFAGPVPPGSWPEAGGPAESPAGDVGAEDPTPVDPRIGRPARRGTLAALLTALVAAAAVVPVVAFAAALAWSLLSRVTDASLTSLVLRRITHGSRRSDVPRAVLLGPWHLVTGALATVFGLLVPLLVGVATAYSVSLLMATVSGGRPVIGTAPALASGAAAAILMGWWGPGGTSLRRGSRSALRAVTPSPLAAELATGLLVTVAVGAGLWAFVRGGTPLWWPFTPPSTIFGVRIR